MRDFKYSEMVELKEKSIRLFKIGTEICNHNIGGTSNHVVTGNDRFGLAHNGILLLVNGTTSKLIVVCKNGEFAKIFKDGK